MEFDGNLFRDICDRHDERVSGLNPGGLVALIKDTKQLIDWVRELREKAEMGEALESIISASESVNLWSQEGLIWIEVDAGDDDWIPAKGKTLALAVQSAKASIEKGGE